VRDFNGLGRGVKDLERFVGVAKEHRNCLLADSVRISRFATGAVAIIIHLAAQLPFRQASAICGSVKRYGLEPEGSVGQMMSAIGSLLWLWAEIERAARKEVLRAHDGILPTSAHGIAGMLNCWERTVVQDRKNQPFRAALASRLRVQLQSALNIRNGICHGLDGVSAAHGTEPGTLKWTVRETRHSITWDELQVLFPWLSKVPGAMQMLAYADQSPHSRMVDRSENREWWVNEYGVDLP
jgi:hypothetical protein